MARYRPSVFVGSSTEELKIAKVTGSLLMIAPDRPQQMNQDLLDLEETLPRGTTDNQ